MELENRLQPNCSELGLVLNTTSIAETVESLRSCDFEVNLYFKHRCWKDLPAAAIEIFVKRFRNAGSDRLDQAGLFVLMGTLPKELHKLLMQDPDECDIPEVRVGRSDDDKEVQLQIGNYCSGGEEPTLQIGDCDKHLFPIFKALEDMDMGKVYGIDGGHEDMYEEWKLESKRRKKK